MGNKITKVISKVTSNKEAKTVANNFLWLSLLQIAGYAFPLITIPYLAKVIGVEGFGKITFAATIMLWIQTIADWGFNLTATRDVAQNRNNPDKVSEIFSNTLWARCVLTIFSFLVLALLVYSIPKLTINADVIFVTFLMIPGHIFFPDWFFQAVEKMKYLTILNVLVKFIFTIAVIVFIKRPEQYIFQPLFTSLGYIISGIIAMYIICCKWQVKLIPPSLPAIFKTIKNGTDVFINNLMPNLYRSFSTLLLGFVYGSGAVGVLDGGNKFIHIGTQLLSTIERAFFPFLSRRIDKHNLFKRINIGISTIMALVLFIFAPLLIRIFLTDEFADSVGVLRIRALSLIFLAIANTYGKNFLIIHHKETIMRKVTMYCCLIGFAIAWPLVYKYSYIGASLTVIISIALLAISYYIVAKIVQRKLKV